jgi:hypothetical protein
VVGERRVVPAARDTDAFGDADAKDHSAPDARRQTGHLLDGGAAVGAEERVPPLLDEEAKRGELRATAQVTVRTLEEPVPRNGVRAGGEERTMPTRPWVSSASRHVYTCSLDASFRKPAGSKFSIGAMEPGRP